MTQGETKGHKGRQEDTRGDKTLGKADAPQLTKGNKGRQDPREGGRTTQQRGSRKGDNGETRGDKTLGKADTPFNTLRKH